MDTIRKKPGLLLLIVLGGVILWCCWKNQVGENYANHGKASHYGANSSVGGGSSPWSLKPCNTKACADCPCAPDKPCPSCPPQIIGFNRYGPASINRVQTAYPCPQGVISKSPDPNVCSLYSTDALRVCRSTAGCTGVVCDPTNSTDCILVNVAPYNTGSPTTTIYFEKL